MLGSLIKPLIFGVVVLGRVVVVVPRWLLASRRGADIPFASLNPALPDAFESKEGRLSRDVHRACERLSV
jgi:hypothetical protein